MITAVILAAGQSRRMGQPKANLPWGETTVLSHILDVLEKAAIDGIVVVTGSVPFQNMHQERSFPVQFIQNTHAAQSGMLTSLQVGLRSIPPECSAALVTLGDQPQIELDVVRSLIKIYRSASCPILVPSYQNRRGHPWLLGRSMWEDVLGLNAENTMRDFLYSHSSDITYIEINSASILQDMDTPADYEHFRPT